MNNVLSSIISSRIIERLGEDAADKIASFLDVNQIMVEEVGSSLIGSAILEKCCIQTVLQRRWLILEGLCLVIWVFGIPN